MDSDAHLQALTNPVVHVDCIKNKHHDLHIKPCFKLPFLDWVAHVLSVLLPAPNTVFLKHLFLEEHRTSFMPQHMKSIWQKSQHKIYSILNIINLNIMSSKAKQICLEKLIYPLMLKWKLFCKNLQMQLNHRLPKYKVYKSILSLCSQLRWFVCCWWNLMQRLVSFQ